MFPLKPLLAGACSVALSSMVAGVGTPVVHASCSSPWTIVPTPAMEGPYGLNGVVALSATQAWAVGDVVEFWDGTSWSIVSTPTPPDGILMGVSAVSASDVWAVGFSFPPFSAPARTLIEHWNGGAWSVVPSPNVGKNGSGLRGVAAFSSSNVWAVGSYRGATAERTLIEHWDGTSWKVVSSPNLGGLDNFLLGVGATSANDVMAVGYYVRAGHGDKSLAMHWDGASWRTVATPNLASSHFRAITAIASNDAWAVGEYSAGPGLRATLAEHWNGRTWSRVETPNPAGAGLNNFLLGVAAVAANNVWAVGWYESSTTRFQVTLVEHWNGASWTVVPSPNGPPTADNALVGATAVSTGDIWGVGYDNSNSDYTFIEHACQS